MEPSESEILPRQETNNLDIQVRHGGSEDLDTIVGFNAAMAAETEDKGLDLARLRRGVAAVFADSTRGFYLVAESQGQAVGQLMITVEWSDWRNAYFWWIQSVYVDANHRRQGVYRALHQRVCELARQEGNVCGIRLYVERANRIAQQTYSSLGLSHSHYDMYEVEFPN